MEPETKLTAYQIFQATTEPRARGAAYAAYQTEGLTPRPANIAVVRAWRRQAMDARPRSEQKQAFYKGFIRALSDWLIAAEDAGWSE